jgi:hypothetical protein
VDLPKLLLHEREDRLNGEGGDFNSNAELPMNTTTMAYNASGWQYVELPSESILECGKSSMGNSGTTKSSRPTRCDASVAPSSFNLDSRISNVASSISKIALPLALYKLMLHLGSPHTIDKRLETT